MMSLYEKHNAQKQLATDLLNTFYTEKVDTVKRCYKDFTSKFNDPDFECTVGEFKHTYAEQYKKENVNVLTGDEFDVIWKLLDATDFNSDYFEYI